MHDGTNFLRRRVKPHMTIEAVRPEAKQGGPYGSRDIVRTRVRKASSWPLMDMLSDDSIRHTIQVYNSLKSA